LFEQYRQKEGQRILLEKKEKEKAKRLSKFSKEKQLLLQSKIDDLNDRIITASTKHKTINTKFAQRSLTNLKSVLSRQDTKDKEERINHFESIKNGWKTKKLELKNEENLKKSQTRFEFLDFMNRQNLVNEIDFQCMFI